MFIRILPDFDIGLGRFVRLEKRRNVITAIEDDFVLIENDLKIDHTQVKNLYNFSGLLNWLRFYKTTP
jgi:hypothetical protein